MKTEAARFVEEMLREIRTEFFAGLPEKRYWQERPLLIRAICCPAAWMKKRGAKAPLPVYRRILGLVMRTIHQKGRTGSIRSFGRYFLYSVQQHMNHHGEDYYYEAKLRPVAEILPEATPDVAPCKAPDPTTEIMSQLNAVLRSRGGRRRRDSVSQEGDLFGHCKRSAADVQKPV